MAYANMQLQGLRVMVVRGRPVDRGNARTAASSHTIYCGRHKSLNWNDSSVSSLCESARPGRRTNTTTRRPAAAPAALFPCTQRRMGRRYFTAFLKPRVTFTSVRTFMRRLHLSGHFEGQTWKRHRKWTPWFMAFG